MGVTYLLDTHAFVWLCEEGRDVPAEVSAQLADPANRLLVSSASAMEVATKVRLGKLAGGAALVAGWLDSVDRLRAEELAVTTAHALLAGTLAWSHRDPFDRLLAAQALGDGLVLVSADRVFRGLGGLSLLPW